MTFTKWQESVAEFLGTMVIMLFGCGSVAMVLLFPSIPPIKGQIINGGYTNIVFGWGLAVTFGIYVAGTVSGAHLNPAVTIGLAATKRFPWWKTPHYILAQMCGGFAGAALVFAVYYFKWIEVDPNFDHTTQVFATFPAVPGFWPAFFDQVVGTALLVGLIIATGDKLNLNPLSNLAPIVIGLVVVAIGISFGAMQGYAINPARDLGPRLFAVLAGFKNNGLTDGTGIWLPPVIGPIVGGVLGAFAYDLTIGLALRQSHDTGAPVEGMDPTYHEDIRIREA
jgi:glycerol uptake facilitator protein